MDMEQLASIFEAVKVLPLRPGDYIVCRLKQSIPREAHERIREAMSAAFDGRRVVVLDPALDIEIVRPEPASV